VKGLPPVRDIPQIIASAKIYAEYVGGLGDSILRMYFAGKSWHEPLLDLKDDEHAVISFMSHSPYISEIFNWHPKRKNIYVLDLGFNTTFHPWENSAWRLKHGLPENAPCPPYTPSETLEFFPSSDDRVFMKRLGLRPYIVLASTAGRPEKTIPYSLRRSVVVEAIRQKFQIVVVGRSHYFEDGRSNDVPEWNGVVNAIDILSVPGTAELVKRAAGIISADTSVLHMAWQEKRPVFLLYNKWTKDNLVSRGPVGYMQGIDRENTDHMEFSEFALTRKDLLMRNKSFLEALSGGDQALIIDNGRQSIDMRAQVEVMPFNLGVAGSWNFFLKMAFVLGKFDLLVILQDDIIWDQARLDLAKKLVEERKDVDLILSDFQFSVQVHRPENVKTIGFYDERYYPAWCEDDDYALTIIQRGRIYERFRELDPLPGSISNGTDKAVAWGDQKRKLVAKWGKDFGVNSPSAPYFRTNRGYRG
jgi:hypothetical protein